MRRELTARETQVCADRGQGLSYKAISAKRGISISTVKSHLDRIHKKRGVHSSLELQEECRIEGCSTCLQPFAARVRALSVKSALFNERLQAWRVDYKR